MFTIPPSAFTFFILIATGTLYYILTWYCDHVISSNRGVSR